MSHFDFPRIHFRGMIRFNVGTANNDDYASETVGRDPLRLADTDNVQPVTCGYPDTEFTTWATNVVKANSEEKYIPVEWNYYGDMGVALEFLDDKGNVSQVRVASVQTGPSAFVEASEDLDALAEAERLLLEPFLGATLSFKKRPGDIPTAATTYSEAIIIDCAQEGSSQSSQLFTDNLLLVKAREGGQLEQLLGRKIDSAGQYVGGGQPSKASTLWMNFQRNVNMDGPGGASGTFHSVMEFGDGVESSRLQALFERYTSRGDKPIKGVVIRYNFFRVRAPYRDNLDKLPELYAQKQQNPGIGEVVGTLAPWYEDDECETHSLGRLLVPPKAYGLTELMQLSSGEPGTFPKPEGRQGNGSAFRLAPVIARVNSGLVLSLDVVNTFPEDYQQDFSPKNFHQFAYHDDTDPESTYNPKYNLGKTLKLMLKPPASDSEAVQIATLGFDDQVAGSYGSYGTAAYYQHGGMIDIQLSAEDYQRSCGGDLEEDLAGGELSLVLEQEGGEDEPLLVESELMVVPNQPTVYTEQVLGRTARVFNFNGSEVPCTLSIYKRGRPITDAEYQERVQSGHELVLQELKLTPLQDAESKNNEPLHTYRADSLGYALSTKVDQPFTKLFAVTWEGASQSGLLEQQAQVDTLVHPLIYVRILPNTEDFSQYYEDPDDLEPVGNDSLTFMVIYEKVFRNYHLLYPAMSEKRRLSHPQMWEGADAARRLMDVIAPEAWPALKYMPRTRDLSSTRRTLLQAWARKFLREPATAGAARLESAAGAASSATTKQKPILR